DERFVDVTEGKQRPCEVYEIRSAAASLEIGNDFPRLLQTSRAGQHPRVQRRVGKRRSTDHRDRITGGSQPDVIDRADVESAEVVGLDLERSGQRDLAVFVASGEVQHQA